MTRVAMVVMSDYPADPRVRREAEALARVGVSVDVICVRGPGESPWEVCGSIVAHRVFRNQSRERLAGYLVFTILFAMIACWRLFWMSLRHKYDLVQIHNMPDYLVFVGLWQKLLRRPVVLDIHDLTVELFESRWHEGRFRILLPFIRWTEKLACGFADHIITSSAGFQQRLIDRGVAPGKITLIMNTADPLIFRKLADDPLPPNDPPVFLYHGTVAPRFGIHILIAAIGLLWERGVGCRLNINGSYDTRYRQELARLVARSGLEDRVCFGGYLPLEEIRLEIAQTDIGVVPYLSDLFMDLALSTKGFEYVAMGVPVIASRLPSMSSIFPVEAVCYFESGSSKDLADQMEFMLAHRDLWPDYVAAADEAYRPYAWPMMVELYLELIQRLVRV